MVRSSEGHCRGQMIVLTAIVFATVVIGAAVLVGDLESSEVLTREGGDVHHPTTPSRATLQKLSSRMHAAGPVATVDHLRETLRDEVGTLANQLRDHSGLLQDTVIDVALADSGMTVGTLVADPNRSSDFTLPNESRQSEISVRISRDNPASIERFTLAIRENSVSRNASNATEFGFVGTDRCHLVGVRSRGDRLEVLTALQASCDADVNHSEWTVAARCPGSKIVRIGLVGVSSRNAVDCHIDAVRPLTPIASPDRFGFVIHRPYLTRGGYQYLLGPRMSPEFVAEPYPLFAGDRTNVFAAPVLWRLKFQVSRIQIRMHEEKAVRVDVHRAPAFWRDVTVEWVA